MRDASVLALHRRGPLSGRQARAKPLEEMVALWVAEEQTPEDLLHLLGHAFVHLEVVDAQRVEAAQNAVRQFGDGVWFITRIRRAHDQCRLRRHVTREVRVARHRRTRILAVLRPRDHIVDLSLEHVSLLGVEVLPHLSLLRVARLHKPRVGALLGESPTHRLGDVLVVLLAEVVVAHPDRLFRDRKRHALAPVALGIRHVEPISNIDLMGAPSVLGRVHLLAAAHH
mmetsp:Transcript_148675/g.360929  ORF Transcript_148675/g.360929 Transcript_148675/m.360929 type:complete len:227 (-) Transcript_148675:166-846(-)